MSEPVHAATATCARLAAGDAIAIDMPMTVEAVVAYLGIVLAGCVVVAIADSFAATEIATRLGIAHAKAIFTQVPLHGGGLFTGSWTLRVPAARCVTSRHAWLVSQTTCQHSISCANLGFPLEVNSTLYIRSPSSPAGCCC